MPTTSLQRLLEAGLGFTEMPRKQVESVVRQLVQAGDVQRRDAEQLIQSLVERGRETSERLNDVVQQEVARQLGWMSERFDDLEDRLEQLATTVATRVGQGSDVGQAGESTPIDDAMTPSAPRSGTVAKKTATKTAGKKKTAKKTAGKKAAGKKTAAKKAAGKKTAAKKAAGKKTAAKKSTGKKTARKAPAKKATSPSTEAGASSLSAAVRRTTSSASGQAVGSSGVPQIATTRAARDAR